MFFGSRKKMLKRLESAIGAVKVAIFTQLHRRYQLDWDEDTAGMLAGAVTNAMFSTPSEVTQHFVTLQGELVGQKLIELQEDQTIRQAVTDTLRVCLYLESARQRVVVEPRTYPPLQRLAELGLLVPGGQAPEPEAFCAWVVTYCATHVDGVADELDEVMRRITPV